MANHVTTIITIKTNNDKSYNKLQQSFNKELEIEDLYKTLYESNIAPKGEEYINNIGAKWCKLIDPLIWDDGAELILESAWDFPEPAFKQLYNLLQPIDPNILIHCSYRDEADMFVGAAAYGPNGYNRLQEDDLDYPNQDDMTDEEFEEAINLYEQNLDNTIGTLKQICINNSK